MGQPRNALSILSILLEKSPFSPFFWKNLHYLHSFLHSLHSFGKISIISILFSILSILLETSPLSPFFSSFSPLSPFFLKNLHSLHSFLHSLHSFGKNLHSPILSILFSILSILLENSPFFSPFSPFFWKTIHSSILFSILSILLEKYLCSHSSFFYFCLGKTSSLPLPFVSGKENILSLIGYCHYHCYSKWQLLPPIPNRNLKLLGLRLRHLLSENGIKSVTIQNFTVFLQCIDC